jgi:hypothetical protein
MTTTTNRTTTIQAPSLLDAEVQPSTTRPSWTAAEKLAILAEYESYPRAAPERGALGAPRHLHLAYLQMARKSAIVARWRPSPHSPAAPSLLPTTRLPIRSPDCNGKTRVSRPSWTRPRS